MAALVEPRRPELIELRDVGERELNRVLDEERLAWRAQLHWDFTPSADLVRRFVRIQALNGYALLIDGACAGYTYFVSEDGKALIGDLYVVRRWASPELEDMLLRAALNALVASPALRRIEAQLMMMHGAFERNTPLANLLSIHPRNLMMIDMADADALPAGMRASSMYLFSNWSEEYQAEGARVIAAAYEGHVDSSINDQYRSEGGARRFLSNIVQYPGCGAFNGAASWVARDAAGRVAGLSLASTVADEVGHITQICVAPDVKGTGLGYELLRRSLTALSAQGCTRASLTVTASNTDAMRLYQSVGFRPKRRFAAYVWDGL